MKRIALISLLVSLAGCSVISSNQSPIVTISPEQKEFLKSISINEERLEEGILLSWQRNTLAEYNTALEYLEKKYPGSSFHISGCERSSSRTVFYFLADGYEGLFEIYLYKENDIVYEAKDNFYGKLLETQYEEKLLMLLKESVPECVAVDTIMSTVQDELFNVESLIDGSVQLTNQTSIFVEAVSMDEASELIAEVEEAVRNNHVYGSYYVYAVSSMKDYKSGNYLMEKSFREFNL